jgi:hypothetical protein
LPPRRPVCAALHPRRRRPAAAAAASSSDPAPPSTKPAAVDPLKYDHLLVALIDTNPYLTPESQAVVAAAADMATAHRATKISVLLIDESTPGKSSESSPGADASVRLKTVSWHLKERGCDTDFEFLERAVEEKGAASALVGDVADEVSADLLLLSSAGVHAKHVDANLLAEFVSCPVLILP